MARAMPPSTPDWFTRASTSLATLCADEDRACAAAGCATEGCRIYLDDGRVLIDGIASWWTACHGYNHPHIAAAIARQLETMPHVMFAGFVHEPAAPLATRLAALLPGDLDRVFFSESGSVAVEIALKMARQYWRNRGEPRGKFLAFRDGYHGDTAAAMAVSDPATGMHGRASGFAPDQLIADLPRETASAARLDEMLARNGRHRRDRYRAAGPRRRRDDLPRCRDVAACARSGRSASSLVDRRRDFHRLSPHRRDVRLRRGRCRAGYRHPLEGADRRCAAACGDGDAPSRRRGLSVGRCRGRLDARPDLHGERARLRGGECLARAFRARRSARSGRGDRSGACGAISRRAEICAA